MALTVIGINRLRKRWNLKGFLDDDPKKAGQRFCSRPVLGGRSLILKKKFKGRLLAVPGHPDRFTERVELIRSLRWPEDRWATLVDPMAVVSPDAKIGRNTVILSHAYVGPSARIGDHCVVLSHSSVHHDAVVEDFSMIGSHVSVSGSCRVGRGCYIGSNASLRQDVRVGAGSLIGMGAVIVKDVPAGVVVVGNPGRILRKVS